MNSELDGRFCFTSLGDGILHMYNRISIEKQGRVLVHAALVIVLAFILGSGLGIPVMAGMVLLGYSLTPLSTEVLAAMSIAQYVGFMVVVGPTSALPT